MLPRLMILLLAVGGTCVAAGEAPQRAWDTCAECHEDLAQGFAHSIHARILGYETPTGRAGCESCHGDAAEHLDSGEATSLTRFGEDSETDNAACLACHARHTIKEWDVSAHADELSCTDCHSIHDNKAPDSRCAECHYDVEATMRAPSHHPVPEGKMSCASCHNVHAANESALKTDERTNDLCLDCHAAKQGPFVFEHDPVMEDCMLCHTPHGSAAASASAGTPWHRPATAGGTGTTRS